MTFTIAVANEKGGCGKTTTAMNLAGGFTRIGFRVLVVDATFQASAIMWSRILPTSNLPFHVVSFDRLKNAFDKFGVSSGYDIILVDCPSHIVESNQADAAFARSAIREANAVLIPILPSTLDFSATLRFLRYLRDDQKADRKVVALINQFQLNLLGGQSHAAAEALFTSVPNSKVLRNTIGLRASITEVCGSGKTIFEYARSSTAAQEYEGVTKEIVACLSLPVAA